MLESKKDNLNEINPIPHPKIPFVYIHNNKLFCIHHLAHNGMNQGSMRQHIEGKNHQLNFDTGEKLEKTDVSFEKLIHKANWPNQKLTVDSGQDKFWELKAKLDVLFPDHPETIRTLLAKHAVDGQIKWDIIENLRYNKEADLVLLAVEMQKIIQSQKISHNWCNFKLD